MNWECRLRGTISARVCHRIQPRDKARRVTNVVTTGTHRPARTTAFTLRLSTAGKATAEFAILRCSRQPPISLAKFLGHRVRHQSSTLIFSRMPAAFNASIVVFMEGIVTVSRAERARMLALVSFNAAMNFSGGHVPHQRRSLQTRHLRGMDTTRFLPDVVKVALHRSDDHAVPPVSRREAESKGRNRSNAPFIARPEGAIPERNTLHTQKDAPTSAIAGIIVLAINSPGSICFGDCLLRNGDRFFESPFTIAS